MRRWILLLLILCLLPAAAQPARPQLYRITLLQAAPGRLLELIDAYQKYFAALQAAGVEQPMWMRHSQGDHWDILIIEPMGSYSDYYSDSHQDKLLGAGQSAPLSQDLIAWREDWFCYGPSLTTLRKAFAEGGFFHVEMFQALPGSLGGLLREREMENAYARALQQPENHLFTRSAGAASDIVTIGVFRDLKHYAASADATPEAQQAAARAAGFESPAQIGPYLRRFIRTHHDTLAVAIK